MNTKIQQIIQNRSKAAAEVSAYLAKWQERESQNKALKRELKELRNICTQAIAGASDSNDVSAFRDLAAYLDTLEQEQQMRKMQADCSFAVAQFEKLNQRFNRQTINIAVAGVGRCGKSTALKAVIGQKQEDNCTIPSGDGPAITAGKSTISCVASAEEEKTVVRYHTFDSFLNELINPLLQSVSLPEYQCNSVEDFEALDFETLKEALDLKSEQAAAAVKTAEFAIHQAENKTEAELRLQQAKAYASSFNLNYERLNHLRNIMKAFPYFRTRLTGMSDAVPLNQTHRYVRYPENDEPAICYAVKECRIYSRFPNNSVNALELTDLPGLGTGSQSEKKCFLDGFHYAVDLALMIRRPEGLFQNFTTDADLSVLEVLGATFGENHLHECMVMFQNDANLPHANAELSYAKIEEWNKQRKHPLTVFRGNAYDSEFMQKTLLPQVLAFIAEHLPALDKALADEVLPRLNDSAREFDEQQNAISVKLASFKRLFPNGDGAIAIHDKSDKIRDTLMNGLNSLMERYGNEIEGQNSTLTDAVEKQTAVVKEWVNTQYDPRNEQQVEEVKNRIRSNMSALPYANREIHAIRIRISEVYSELEKIHDTLISEMQQAVAGVLHGCFPLLLAEGDNLEKFITLAESYGECPEIVSAVKALVALEVPFYNVIYPDLRKNIFDSMTSLERNFLLSSDTPAEKQAMIVLGELQNIGINWIWKAENLLHSQSKITEIISAALERFQDRMIRNDQTRREMVGFVEHFWSKIQNEENACKEAMRIKLGKY